MFGVLAVILILLFVIVSEVSIVYTYHLLNAGCHRWWWRSFLAAGSIGLYVWICGFLYFFSSDWDPYDRKFSVRVSNTIVYFVSTSLLSIVSFIVFGSVGFLASFSFVKII